MPTARSFALPARVPSLDGLRGIAILLVLLHQLDRLDDHGLVAKILDRALDVGWIGVQLFFVLSGFLITGILLDSRETPGYLRSFFTRRVLRIFPLYFGVLILFLWVLPGLGLAPAAWREHQIWYWVYLANWTEPFLNGPLPHFWSLAVEEQFYLAWPFVILALPARPLLKVCIAIAGASLAARAAMIVAGVPPDAIYMFTTSRIDALVLGGAVAAALRIPGGIPAWLATPRRAWGFATGVGLVGLLAHEYQRTTPLGQTLGYTCLSILFASVILALALEASEAPGAATRWLSSKPLRALGLYSYGMYIFHKPLHDLVGKPLLAALGYPGLLALGPGLAYVAAGTLVILVVGMLSYWLYERHFLALKDRFRPDAAGPPI